MRAFVLADDLTGAADTGLPFVRAGLSARVLLAEGARADADVLVVSTETRNLSREAAVTRLGAWAKRLADLPGGPIRIKKIDSTLRGGIGVEIRAVLDVLAPAPVAWIVPAYPGQGRQMRGGVYSVHGTPLHQTEFVRDVQGCAEHSLVPALLETQMGERIGFVSCDVLAEGSDAIEEAVERAQREGRRAVLFDTLTDEDLDGIVAAGQRARSPVLWAGSAGLAKALARRLSRSGGTIPPFVPPSSGPVVLVAGSRNPATLQQIAFLRERVALDQRTLADAGGSIASAPHYLLTVGEGPGSHGRDELAVASRLGAAGARLITQHGSERLILTGGDTAAATLRHLDAQSLVILGAVEEGIPLLQIIGGAANGALAVTKAGGFGSPSALHNAFARLAGHRPAGEEDSA